jgi:hypothetical protein
MDTSKLVSLAGKILVVAAGVIVANYAVSMWSKSKTTAPAAE